MTEVKGREYSVRNRIVTIEFTFDLDIQRNKTNIFQPIDR